MLIDHYRAIEAASARMLAAAQHQAWPEMLRQQETCAVLIEQLRSDGALQELSPEQRKERNRIMQRILSNDACIRTLTEPWMARIECLINGKHSDLH